MVSGCCVRSSHPDLNIPTACLRSTRRSLLTQCVWCSDSWESHSPATICWEKSCIIYNWQQLVISFTVLGKKWLLWLLVLFLLSVGCWLLLLTCFFWGGVLAVSVSCCWRWHTPWTLLHVVCWDVLRELRKLLLTPPLGSLAKRSSQAVLLLSSVLKISKMLTWLLLCLDCCKVNVTLPWSGTVCCRIGAVFGHKHGVESDSWSGLFASPFFLPMQMQ